MAQIKPAIWRKQAKPNYTGLALILLAVGACLWLLSTVQPLPANCHTVNGYDVTGQAYTSNECINPKN